MKGDMHIARSTDQPLIEKAECGGVVGTLLKYALAGKRVDGVLAVKARGGNRYDGIPVLVTDPEEVAGTVGSLHCASPNIARCLKEYLHGASTMKIAVVCKPCDAKAIVELAKRTQVNLDNVLLIGLNCTGTLPSAKAKLMMTEEFGVDPADVVKEDIEDGKLTITLKDGSEKARELAELEEKGSGRRDNCRRCETNIPTMADLACGKWGAKDEKSTFVEVCSDKGSDFLDEAVKAGVISVQPADDSAKEARRQKDEAAVKSAHDWQTKDFAPFKEMSCSQRFDYWFGQFEQCIKCFGCRDACPICYCKDCSLEADRGIVLGGEVPPDPLFPIIRASHVMDSCVNCGQCQDVCPMELPIALLTFMLNRELATIFDYEPGMDVSAAPPMRTYHDAELALDGVEVAF
ncbi:MAG: Coenzyme F420 hydrogenase/dehydrogenase, beta subunit C-terminal domain [Chloroflexota bacterium]|nr:Coenzyme F420 hydrogenase/dehydrogenase, beta subunit C-terminal domain [Chloroflexota bacterium]